MAVATPHQGSRRRSFDPQATRGPRQRLLEGRSPRSPRGPPGRSPGRRGRSSQLHRAGIHPRPQPELSGRARTSNRHRRPHRPALPASSFALPLPRARFRAGHFPSPAGFVYDEARGALISEVWPSRSIITWRTSATQEYCRARHLIDPLGRSIILYDAGTHSPKSSRSERHRHLVEDATRFPYTIALSSSDPDCRIYDPGPRSRFSCRGRGPWPEGRASVPESRRRNGRMVPTPSSDRWLLFITKSGTRPLPPRASRDALIGEPRPTGSSCCGAATATSLLASSTGELAEANCPGGPARPSKPWAD